jgi:phosphoglycerol transferase MdoB-like AlkP superfamily enzyme
MVLWSLLFIINYFFINKYKESFYYFYIIVLNNILVHQLIDARVKILFLEPLSIDLIKYSLNDFSILSSQISLFCGNKYWPGFIFTLLLFNSLPKVIEFFIERFLPYKFSIVSSLFNIRNNIKSIILAIVIFFISIFIVLLKPDEIYGLNKNFIISSTIPSFTSTDITQRILDSDQKVKNYKQCLSEIDKKYLGLTKNYNIVLYIIESTSYEDSFGVNKDNMPFLNKLLNNGGLAFPCYVQSATSTKGVFSILSGLYSKQGFEIVESRIKNLNGITRVLKEHGYYTAFVSAQNLSYQGMRNMIRNFGFDYFIEYENLLSIAKQKRIHVKDVGFGASDDKLMFIDDLENLHDKKPFFIVYYTSSSHYPYDFPGANSDVDEIRHAQSLSYTDHVFSTLFKSISERKLSRNTLFVVTADHGEEFFNGQFKGRGSTLTEATHKVPLLFFSNRTKFPKMKNVVTRQVDIAASILTLTGINDVDYNTQGTSIFSYNYDKLPIYINTFGVMKNVAIIENNTKLIYSFDSNKMWASKTDILEEKKSLLEDEVLTKNYSLRMSKFIDYNDQYLNMLILK